MKAEGFTYNSYLETAKSLMGQLDLLMKKSAVATEKKEENSASTVSGADEIRKYKQLLDEGILTEEEFQAKKNQLLGI